MKLPKKIGLLLGVVGLAIAGCATSVNPPSPVNSPEASPSPKATTATPGEPTPYRPTNRVVQVVIEGEPMEIPLKLFDEAPLPFLTYVPVKEFQSETQSSPQGTEVYFYFSPTGVKDTQAYVQILIPTGSADVNTDRDSILGEQGLLARQGWELVDRTNVVSYPWAKEKLVYRQRNGNTTTVGSIFIGEHNGRAFYVLTHYPAEYADGFEPRSTVVIENIQFRE